MMSPDTKLHVNGNIRIEGDRNFLQLKETDGNPNENFCISVNDGLLRFNSADDNFSGLSRMVIDQKGNVGIGTTIPGERLEVAGNIQLSGGSNMKIVSTSGDLEIRATRPNGEGDIRVELAEGNRFAVRCGDVDLLRVQSTGNVGIGAYPSYKLHVNGTVFALGAARNLSDQCHKTNINDISFDALDLIKDLHPVTFEWKEPHDSGMEGTQLGFIAQEVEKVFPEAVLTQENEEQTKGLKYNALIPLLTKAIQELDAQNEALKAENNSLRHEIEQIKEAIYS